VKVQIGAKRTAVEVSDEGITVSYRMLPGEDALAEPDEDAPGGLLFFEAELIAAMLARAGAAPTRENCVALASAVSPPFPPTILGLYRGPVGRGAPGSTTAPAVPAQAPRVDVPGDEPVSIVLYRKNLARAVKTRSELSEQIRDTLLHEIGHLEGLDEDDLRRRGME